MKKAQPDVIGLEEAETNTARLAKAAGYPYWSDATQVVSRYPILAPGDGEGELRAHRARPPVAASRWPTCTCRPTIPGRRPSRGVRRSVKVLAAEEKYRLPYIQTAPCRSCRRWRSGASPRSWRATSTRRPGVITRRQVVGTRDYVKYVVEWPVSKAVEATGCTDSWRAVYPDPLKSFGPDLVGGASEGGGVEPRARTRRRAASTSSTRPARRRPRPPSSPANRAARK